VLSTGATVGLADVADFQKKGKEIFLSQTNKQTVSEKLHLKLMTIEMDGKI